MRKGTLVDDVTALLRPGLLIGSEWVQQTRAGSIEHVNPATGKVQQSVPVAGAGEVDAAVAAARVALPRWRSWMPSDRMGVLRRIADGLRSRAPECATITTLENGTPALLAGFMPEMAAMCCDYYAGWTDKLVGDVCPVGSGLDYTRLEPYGVVAVMPTWNAPLGMIGFKVAPALAAGCTVVLKAPELAPFTANVFGEICLEAGLPPGVVNVITGGPESGDALVRHPGVDKISFTGGTETGRRIQAAAAETLTPVVLELGGKSASIVFEDSDLSRAASSAVMGIVQLSGQVCIAPTRLLVQDSVYDQVVEQVVAGVGLVSVGDPFNMQNFMGPVISRTACERIEGVVERARSEASGSLLVGGTRLDGDLADGFFITPTVFGDVDPGSHLAQNEIFGPVLAISRFRDEREAVALANGSAFGLAAYVHTESLGRAHRVAAELDAGNISVNGAMVIPGPAAPFGGFKASGHGKEGALAGVMEFIRVKNINIDIG
jgi:aldehyde dehydrogenase (NAD+)